ncbi:hypothetical protein [Enterocloster citroniae]|uniref:hypothetical protein n=1 Tax=Enterocloster citroniae TaxID=358743 RepID=UPI001896F0A8|nr:hypothetical protein [Enterocloster citroniae]
MNKEGVRKITDKKNALRQSARGGGFEYTVKEYPLFDQVSVLFQLPYRDWKKFEDSKLWSQVCKHLSEAQKVHNQK